MSDQEDQEKIQKALQAAVKEWLDEKFATFGKWTAASLGALLLAAIIIFILKMSGWTPPAP